MENKVFFLERLRRRLQRQRWTCRKISFVAILIATSVSLTIVFSRIMPIASLPSFKLMAGGLPIKITGYIFGPIIGAITGIASDLISFLFLPSYYHPFYTLAFAFAGMVPGFVGILMNRLWKDRKEVQKEFEKKLNWTNYIFTIIIISFIICIFFVLIIIQGDDFFKKQEMIKNKWLFLFISISGISTMLIGLFIFKIFMKPKLLNSILPIIVFSAFLDLINTPMVTLGDIAVFQGFDQIKSKFITIAVGHMLLTPMKSWGNMIIILIAYRIISPLIYSKSDNGWTNISIKLTKEKPGEFKNAQ